MKNSRRNFVKKAMAGATAISLGGILPGFSAKSYANILGANERINVASMGVNLRGLPLGKNFAKQPNCEIIYACDVDSRVADKFIDEIGIIQKRKPKAEPDFRRVLEDKQLDALVVATPDHWHVPASIMALQAGKHVYVEKPLGHNPNEGELLIEAVKKYKRVLQMGNARRSKPGISKAVKELKAGVIGRAYCAKTWFNNERASIGIGKKVAVPSWLDYELWQGPAPRRPYQDNIIHYNWHWFWNWGTGEACNNGIHSVDVGRWGLGVDYPVRVTSGGGRYRFKDDWETPDTQVINFEFDNNTFMTWEGRSCNGRKVEGNANATIFYGDTGSLLVGNDSYTVFDLEGALIREVKNDPNTGQTHIQNFFEGIRDGIEVNSEVVGGHKSTLLCQLGNIALRTGRTLNINSQNGHILNDNEAMGYWSREYESGWAPKV